MNPLAPRLPSRATKPRSTGLTMVIDGGIPQQLFADSVSSAAEYIDFVKFGWGTAIVTGSIRRKIDLLREHGIGFYFGGTLFEKYVTQERFDDYKRFCLEHGASHVEVSNGTILMSNAEKASYIRKLADDPNASAGELRRAALAFLYCSPEVSRDPRRARQNPHKIHEPDRRA